MYVEEINQKEVFLGLNFNFLRIVLTAEFVEILSSNRNIDYACDFT